MTKVKSLQAELRELRMRKPFRPFRIVTKDGKRYTVGRPLWFAFNEDKLLVLKNGGVGQEMKFTDVETVEIVKRKR